MAAHRIYNDVPRIARADLIGQVIQNYYYIWDTGDEVQYLSVFFELRNGRRFTLPYPPWPCNPFEWVQEMPLAAKKGEDVNLLSALRSGDVTDLLVCQTSDGYIDEMPLMLIGGNMGIIYDPASLPGIGGGTLSLLPKEQLNLASYSDYWEVDEDLFHRWYAR